MNKVYDQAHVKTLFKCDDFTIQSYKDEWLSISIKCTNHYETVYMDNIRAGAVADKITKWEYGDETHWYDVTLDPSGTGYKDYVNITASSDDPTALKWFHELVKDRLVCVTRHDGFEIE